MLLSGHPACGTLQVFRSNRVGHANRYLTFTERAQALLTGVLILDLELMSVRTRYRNPHDLVPHQTKRLKCGTDERPLTFVATIGLFPNQLGKTQTASNAKLFTDMCV